jgi:glyoxylase-like metal-dependent hydrolase (beta-lactamase superfamily II)
MQYFRYHNTNCFFIKNEQNDTYLAIDAGWPCTLREYQRSLKNIGIRFAQISTCIVTHLHMDHAGLLSEFIEHGIKCLIAGKQSDKEIDDMERIIKKNCSNYQEIDKSKIFRVSIERLNEVLEQEGFKGEVIETDGHSPDSISYITKDKEAIIGDLAPIGQILDDEKSEGSWEKIKEKKVKCAYPSHANVFEL